MANETHETVAEAREAVSELAEKAVAGEMAQATVDAVVEAAAEKVEAAHETAQAIADAAMQTELGRQIADLRKDVEKWPVSLAETKAEMEALKSSIATMQGQLAAAATLAVSALPQADLSSSNLPQSATTKATETLETVIPDNLSAVDESPVPEIAPKRRQRWI